MSSQFRTSNGVMHACTYQVIWCTKYRRPVLEPQIAAALQEHIRAVCAQRSADLIDVSVQPDTVSLRVGVDPQFGVHRLVKQIKSVSSGDLRSRFQRLKTRLPTLWSHSYFVVSTGAHSAARLAEFLDKQKESPTRPRVRREGLEAPLPA